VWAVVVGVALAGGPVPAYGSPGAPDPVSPDPVALVVGLRSDTDVVSSLEQRTDVDVVDSAPLSGAVTVDVPADQAGEATSALRADPAVAYVEPDHVAHMAVVPNDPGYAGQWGLGKTRVAAAWDSTRGTGTVTVAVVDTGVKALPDLAGRLLPGKDFVNGDNDAGDDNGHGTMTAGVIAAGGNNGIGIAGICWACRILPVKVLDSTGSGSYSDIAEGIRYAADRGADIINLSLGGSADGQILRDAVAYAAGKGSLVIAAAGNDGSTAFHYPAAIPSVLAVGASTAGDGRYAWSNYGPNWVDIAAPGCNPAQQTNGVIGQFCGTSSATPFTSGVAALLASTTPQPSAAAIRAALTSSADPLAGHWVAAGSGRVNADAALDALPFWITGAVSGQLVGNAVTITPHVSAASGITAVTARLNGTVVATSTGAPWTLTVDTRAVRGSATLVVSGTRAGVVKGSTTLAVYGDHARPATSFRILPSATAAAPVHGFVTIGARAADDAGVARVQLLASGRLVGTDTTAPYAYRWRTTPLTGRVTLMLRAYDRAGNIATATTTVVADNTRPVVTITKAPANRKRHIRRTAYVYAGAADASGIRQLELVVDGKVTQRYAGRTHRFSVQTWKHGRSMTIRVRAYDRADNVRVTSARTWYR
jgi:thermitase